MYDHIFYPPSLSYAQHLVADLVDCKTEKKTKKSSRIKSESESSDRKRYCRT